MFYLSSTLEFLKYVIFCWKHPGNVRERMYFVGREHSLPTSYCYSMMHSVLRNVK